MNTTRWLRPLVQLSGIFRKEMVETIRQPRLILLLVAGPFLVLLLFAVGYDQEQVLLRTTFVGPEGSIYERSVEQFAEELSGYVDYQRFTSDEESAVADLESGDSDLVVVFPPDPAASVLNGERATITVRHDKLDPLQQTAVEISTRVAVQELNATVLERVLTEVQTALVPYEESIEETTEIVAELEDALERADSEETERLASELSVAADELATILAASDAVASELRSEMDPAEREAFDAVTAASMDLGQISRRLLDQGGGVDGADVEAAADAVAQLREGGERVTTLDPGVVVRPFVGDTQNILRERVNINDFFAPGAIALLLQHMALTFAAMSLVSDRSLGLFEVLSVGPIGAGRVLGGKYLAFGLLGGFVAASLLAAVVFLLEVPFRGSVGWAAAGIALLLVASIGLGMILSLLAKTSTQAVQYAMLALLASLFFGGFFLDLDAFRYPVKAITWLLPVTYGVRLLRDVMLRGAAPSVVDIGGLVATSVVFGTVSWRMLARRIGTR